jgi:hypothetical protein
MEMPDGLLKSLYYWIVERAGAWAIMPFVLGVLGGIWFNSEYLVKEKLNIADSRVAAATAQAAAEKSAAELQAAMRSQVEEQFKKAKEDYSTLDTKYKAVVKELEQLKAAAQKQNIPADPIMVELSNVNNQWVEHATAIPVRGGKYSLVFQLKDYNPTTACVITLNDYTDLKHPANQKFMFSKIGDGNSISIGGRQFMVIFRDYDPARIDNAGKLEK